MMGKPLVDVIIPVYRPDDSFRQLLSRLRNQTIPPRKIILMITEEEHGERPEFPDEPDTECHYLSKREFDHGNTRNQGVSFSDADYVLLMTQDAMPDNDRMIETLLEAFSEERVASSYARQLPREDCREIEAFTRSFSYPEVSTIKLQKDLERLGIRTYFCSNVCAMYDRRIMEKLGGFTRHTIFNEDMIYAYEVIRAGYSIAYCANARVIHSHNYSGRQQLHRNFDLAVSQADHPEIFSAVSSEKEGIGLVKKTIRHLFSVGKWYSVPYLFYQSGMKYAGYFLGKRYKKLPQRLVRRLSMNKNYWEE